MANEKRLIDANALRKRMFSYYGCVNENSSKEYYRGETLMNYEVADMIEDCIDNATTIDTVEVVHGRWETVSSMLGYLCCSQCKDVYIWDTWLGDGKWNYCPYCGAKMDLKGEDK